MALPCRNTGARQPPMRTSTQLATDNRTGTAEIITDRRRSHLCTRLCSFDGTWRRMYSLLHTLVEYAAPLYQNHKPLLPVMRLQPGSPFGCGQLKASHVRLWNNVPDERCCLVRKYATRYRTVTTLFQSIVTSWEDEYIPHLCQPFAGQAKLSIEASSSARFAGELTETRRAQSHGDGVYRRVADVKETRSRYL